MKKIGSGVQYNVYDIGNNRVKKIQTSFFQKILRFHRIAPKYKIYSHLIHNIKTSISAGEMTEVAMDGLKKHLTSIDMSLLGNPTIDDNNNYEQDKVLPFGDVVYSVDFDKQKDLMDKYIENMLSCWDYGFSDTNFNFMINSGVTTESKVILVDLGEITWKKDEIRELVQSKNWEKRSSFNKLESLDLKNYIREQFGEKMTVSSLDNHWKSKIK